jgi:DNA topoisomerase I
LPKFYGSGVMNKKGISRKRKSGKKVAWNYYDPSGNLIQDEEIIDRCNKLVLPPAWKDVWISTNARAHLQATGVDVKGRLQYKYHNNWTKRRADQKFDSIVTFAQMLPLVRKKIKADLKLPGMPKEKIVAVIITLMDRYHFRVGNDAYARTNKSYGLTTLRKGHVTIEQSGKARGKPGATFEFTGKSGQCWKKRITENDLALLIKASGRLQSGNKRADLFCYEDETKTTHDIKANHVNEYLDAIPSKYGKITSKCFRTWAATWKSASRFSERQDPGSMNGRKRMANEVIKTVAEDLANTVAVCRSSYIHPVILKDWMEGSFHKKWNKAITGKKIRGLSKHESVTLSYLRKNSRIRGTLRQAQGPATNTRIINPG